MNNSWQPEDHAFFAFVVLSGVSLAYVRDNCTRKSDGKKWISQEQYDHLCSQGLRNKRRCLERYQNRRARDGPNASLEGWTLLPSNYDYSDYINDSKSRLTRMTDELYNLQISPPAATHSSNRNTMAITRSKRTKKSRGGILKLPSQSVTFDTSKVANDGDDSGLNESFGGLTAESAAEKFAYGKLDTVKANEVDAVRELGTGVNGDDGTQLLLLTDVITKQQNGDMAQMSAVALVKPFSALGMNGNALDLKTDLVLVEDDDGGIRTAVQGTEILQVSRLETDTATISNVAGMQITVGKKESNLKDQQVS